MKDDRAVKLRWGGKTDQFTPQPGLAKPRPQVAYSAPDGSGELLHGDNVTALQFLAREKPESVTLAYLDPPFHTNREHHKIVKGKTVEERSEVAAFDDRWTDRAAFLESLAPRIALIRKLLAPHGSMILHVDPKTSHYIKVLCDEIFGEECFASEIIWRYRRWPSKTQNFQRVHDVLLRYRKCAKTPPRWNTLYEPLAASTIATWGVNKQRAVVEKGGRRARSSTTSERTAGVPMGDVWEIGVIAPVARERTGYPTQKPEALLERIIDSVSSPGDLVLDPYAGSGTTLAVAARMNRRFIGIDASDVAISTARTRLETICDRAYAPAARVP